MKVKLPESVRLQCPIDGEPQDVVETAPDGIILNCGHEMSLSKLGGIPL